jgi:hypothetical protein
VAGVSDTRPGAAGWTTFAVMCAVLFFAPAVAQGRTLYINVELSQAYHASQPSGAHWQSTANVSAYYRTTTQALSSGDGTLQLTPTATLGRFTANLSNPVPVLPLDCTWQGSPGPGSGYPLAQLQDGTPFAHALSVRWPAYPDMWDQTLSGSSTGRCLPAFSAVPLQGQVTWALGSATGNGGGNHFLFAAAPRDAGVERGASSASIAPMTMRSLLTRSDGASYTVAAQGFLVESAVAFAGHRSVLPAPSVPADGVLPAPLGPRALRNLGLQVVPRRIPRGCVSGQRRRRHQSCP